jgi:hypothetical protein
LAQLSPNQELAQRRIRKIFKIFLSVEGAFKEAKIFSDFGIPNSMKLLSPLPSSKFV